MDLYQLYKRKQKNLLVYGLENGFINVYDEELIEKLRNIYYGEVPASIILLSNAFSNGYCYDRALLLAKAFIEEDDDINLIYASLDGLKYNNQDPEHCYLERITKDNKRYIYDTSDGFVYDENIYNIIENPKIRRIVPKKDIIKYYEEEKEEVFDSDILMPIIISSIESTYNNSNEIYAHLDILQREIELFKEKINYNKIKENILCLKK